MPKLGALSGSSFLVNHSDDFIRFQKSFQGTGFIVMIFMIYPGVQVWVKQGFSTKWPHVFVFFGRYATAACCGGKKVCAWSCQHVNAFIQPSHTLNHHFWRYAMALDVGTLHCPDDDWICI